MRLHNAATCTAYLHAQCRADNSRLFVNNAQLITGHVPQEAQRGPDPERSAPLALPVISQAALLLLGNFSFSQRRASVVLNHQLAQPFCVGDEAVILRRLEAM